MSRTDPNLKLDLERIIFIGRTFQEYLDMFSLSIEELHGKRILDCPAGACSFTAIGNQSGLDVTACDIAYYYSGEDLKHKGFQDIEYAMEHMEKAKSNYKWNYFNDIEGLRKNRLSALQDCTRDMQIANENYIATELPTLPFDDAEFDVLLSAHFLFTYADKLDFQFHIETLDELLRVTKEEMRIFPIVDLTGKRYQYLDKIIDYLTDQDCKVEEITVPYEFQANANAMLRIKKESPKEK
ncbi:class I SAM-dependent methyltransferase [Gracilibacillus saliphilus]|uniref:class I SAM-dependent methyltransferase n=1 Tax=Gracilibacillus saliphilus TaxID=543890 RepID=UPI0013D63300|nr:class I SAM-dependent methyltransferase [Gracilibacillus saliphilus]